MILGFDVSHFQGAVNFAAARAASRDFVVLKATDGIGYTDPTFRANRAAAHAAGLIVGIYHFAEAGNPVNEAAYFTGVVGALQPGEFLVLDWEKAYTGDHVAWCKAWLDAVRQTTGVAPLIYMNSSTMSGRNWAAVAGTYGLWLAKYDGSTAQPAVTSWSAAAMKQYSDKGTVLGVGSPCDVDVFYGSIDQLRAYCTPGGTNVATAIDMNAFLNTPAYYVNGGTAAGPTISQVLMNLDQFAAPVFRDGKQVPLRQEIADAKTAALAIQATLGGLTPAAIAAAIGQLPAAEAQQIADLVLAGIAAKMNTAP